MSCLACKTLERCRTHRLSNPFDQEAMQDARPGTLPPELFKVQQSISTKLRMSSKLLCTAL